jgi:hypothetical protein
MKKCPKCGGSKDKMLQDIHNAVDDAFTVWEEFKQKYPEEYS